MSNQTEQFTNTEALKLIESTIAQVKNRMVENGFTLLLWGWLVIMGNIISFVLMQYEAYEMIAVAWTVIGTGGGILTVIDAKKQSKKREELKTHIDRAVGSLWAAVGIGGGIFYFYLIFFGPQGLIGPLVLLVIGIGTFASGLILKFKPFIIGGISFWLFAIAALACQNSYQFLICAAAMIPGYLVPGYMLRSLFKQQQDVSEA